MTSYSSCNKIIFHSVKYLIAKKSKLFALFVYFHGKLVNYGCLIYDRFPAVKAIVCSGLVFAVSLSNVRHGGGIGSGAQTIGI
jgi:hypothetical protein